MAYTDQQIQSILATFEAPDRSLYPELDGYSRDEIYHDFFGGGGLYLAMHMFRTLNLEPGDVVLDLGCGKGPTSVYMAQHFGVQVAAVDLWTPAEYLDEKFTRLGLRGQIMPLHMDVTQPLPFAENYFDAIFCMNSFNFYGGNQAYLQHILKHLRPRGQFCLGSEVLSHEFTPEQVQNPPNVYAFHLPAPNENVDVFTGDFLKQHTPAWWRELFERSGLVDVQACKELEDAGLIYQELVRYEHENHLDPFDVQICLDQIEWGRTHQPAKTLFVLTAVKR